MRSFSSQWRSDETIMLLLSAIALFSPDRVNLIHQSGTEGSKQGQPYTPVRNRGSNRVNLIHQSGTEGAKQGQPYAPVRNSGVKQG